MKLIWGKTSTDKVLRILAFLFIGLLFPILSEANPTTFWKSTNGKIKKIDRLLFAQCTRIIYREQGKDDLTKRQKKNLLKALLRGQTRNELSEVIKIMGNSNVCSYGLNSEKFIR